MTDGDFEHGQAVEGPRTRCGRLCRRTKQRCVTQTSSPHLSHGHVCVCIGMLGGAQPMGFGSRGSMGCPLFHYTPISPGVELEYGVIGISLYPSLKQVSTNDSTIFQLLPVTLSGDGLFKNSDN